MLRVCADVLRAKTAAPSISLLALEIVLLQGIVQPGKDSTMPRSEVLPLLLGHGDGEHVQPPAHDQVGIRSLFPLEVRSGFVDREQLGQ